jgi:hypothetical protein
MRDADPLIRFWLDRQRRGELKGRLITYGAGCGFEKTALITVFGIGAFEKETAGPSAHDWIAEAIQSLGRDDRTLTPGNSEKRFKYGSSPRLR